MRYTWHDQAYVSLDVPSEFSSHLKQARATAVPCSFSLVHGHRGKMSACDGAALIAAAVQAACTAKAPRHTVAAVAAAVAATVLKPCSRLRCPAQPDFGGT